MCLCEDSFVVMHTSATQARYLAAVPIGTLATQDSESLQLLVLTEVLTGGGEEGRQGCPSVVVFV
jgi:hypothetical protein